MERWGVAKVRSIWCLGSPVVLGGSLTRVRDLACSARIGIRASFWGSLLSREPDLPSRPETHHSEKVGACRSRFVSFTSCRVPYANGMGSYSWDLWFNARNPWTPRIIRCCSISSIGTRKGGLQHLGRYMPNECAGHMSISMAKPST